VREVRAILGSVCKDLRLLGDYDLTDRALCAFAAVTDAEMPRIDLSYTHVMRKLRKENRGKVRSFQESFKSTFERAIDEELDDPENIALMQAIKENDIDPEDL
jgi:hypothetical protein